MRSSTGRWVSGGDFFNRERELQILETRVRDHNHVLLTGQRRIKTSDYSGDGLRLKVGSSSWPMSRERPAWRTQSGYFPSASRFATGLKLVERQHWISAYGTKFRAGLNQPD